jgi:hypothetical protein
MKFLTGKLYTNSINTSSVKGATIVMCLEDCDNHIDDLVFDCVVLYSDSNYLKYERGERTFELCSRFPYEYTGNFILNNISTK